MIEDSVKAQLRGYFDEACKELRVDGSQYEFQYETIGERFATLDNAAEMDGHILHINEDWVKNSIKENAEFDLRYILCHEVRHIYQHRVIAEFEETGRSSELPVTILSWKQDFSAYTRNEGDTDSWQKNISQSVEIDANAFANAMLLKHNLGARIASGQENIMQKAIANIAKRLWKVTLKI
ncbi:hypothetical protein [Parabacteroides johnsonii]|uniref:hypothetical protein n=1 Tax=Parabacteroides johnsonii TaxID=387661 RepID=UPI001896E47B|nr:hypothetical protein [Parabacteroides johnsonii]